MTSDSPILLSQKITHRARISRTIERLDKLLKPHREKIVAQLPVMLDSGRSDVMLKKTAPSLPDLLVHQAIDMVKVDRLECLEKLIGGMEEGRPLLRRKSLQIFKAFSPNSGKVGILSERSRYLTERRGSGILRS